MSRASHRYQVDAWVQMLNEKGWDDAHAARLCGVAPETIANILSGRTLSARRSTRKKIEDGLTAAGVDAVTLASLFEGN